MAADIEAGPVVDHLRRRIGRGLGIGPRAEIGGKCGGRECDQGCCAKQKLFHVRSPKLRRLTLSKQRGPNLVASRHCRSNRCPHCDKAATVRVPSNPSRTVTAAASPIGG